MFLEKIFGSIFGFGESIGIDLGTASVLVYIKGKRTVCCYNRQKYGHNIGSWQRGP